jgi:translation initiation factor 1
MREMSKKERKNKKITLEKPKDFGSNPFASIEICGLSSFLPENRVPKVSKSGSAPKTTKGLVKIGQGDRLEIRREKSGRGGKTVTTVKPFPSYIGLEQKEKLLKKLKSTLGTGGTWVQQTMELQGDKRKEVYDWMEASGFKPIFAGG